MERKVQRFLDVWPTAVTPYAPRSMRSRRTLIVVSFLVAALLLIAVLSSGDSSHQATRPTTPARPPGKTVVATIPANPAKPPVFKAAEGDLIELSVSATAPGT